MEYLVTIIIRNIDEEILNQISDGSVLYLQRFGMLSARVDIIIMFLDIYANYNNCMSMMLGVRND